MLKKLLIFPVIFMLALFSLQAQNLQQVLQRDSSVRFGKLQNGLTYYIRYNSEPRDRVELRLAIDAGSICEDNNQQGLAHLLEHMSFNGTKHFEKSKLIDFLEKTGVKFGAHLNAFTSFDETVYMLQIPSDRESLVDSGLLVLEDWAHNVTLDSSEIDKERGVVKEEWRLGLGAQERMRNKYIPIILKNSKYAQRLPIGKMAIIDSAHYNTLRRFYKDWYRPDLMAVVVVGDINVDKMEQLIKKDFSAIPNPANERKREIFGIPNNNKPLIAIETDNETTYNMVNIFYKHPRKVEKTVGDYRQYIIYKIFTDMLNARLNEIAQKPTSPFMYASTNYGNFLGRTEDSYSSFAVAKVNKIDTALKVLLDENVRVEKHGFTKTEFDREKKDMLRHYEKLYAERNKQKSKTLIQEYLNNFLEGDPYPGTKAEYNMVKQLLPTIKLDEVNSLPKKWITNKNVVVLITAPKKKGVKVPTQNEVLSIINSTQNTVLGAYKDKVSNKPLIIDSITPGKIVNITKVDTLYEKWTLSNGMEVYIKPTNFKNDEVLYNAYTLGGRSLLADNEVVSAKVLPQIISRSGVGDFSGVNLEKKLAGTIASLNPYIYRLKNGFSGKASPKDLETLLKLQYMYFTHPRHDKEIFTTIIENRKDRAKFMINNPKYAYYDSLYKVITMNSPRVVLFPTPAQYDKIDMKNIFKIYQKLYQHADGFKVFFVGNIDTEKLKPLVEKYLASIPTGTKTNWKDVEPNFPKRKIEFTVFKGKAPQSQVTIAMHGKYKYNFEDNLKMKTLVKILNIKLREKVREEESGTYGIYVSPNLNKYPKQDYMLMLGFGCSPKNVEKLTNSVFDEMEHIRKNGPVAVDMQKAKETFIRARETQERENNFWLRSLMNFDFYGSKIMPETEYNKAVEAVTAKEIKKAAKKYISLNHYVLGVLKPAK